MSESFRTAANFGLYNGDQMSRKEFHDKYETCPDDFKAELIDGTVYVSTPLKRIHGKSHARLGSIFDRYAAHTAGVENCDNTTVFLSDEDEVQPDLLLRILPNHGGQSRTTYTNYIDGAPELVAEVAHSSKAIDLHRKLKRYAEFGVLEYIVLCVHPKQIYWFDFQKSLSRSRTADSEGIFKSSTFPGLWIHSNALLSRDYAQSMEVLDRGLASPEHAAFVRRLKNK